LSESVRPHYSAKRLISGGSYTASGLNNPNLQQQQQQQQIFVNNSQQPVISNPANTLGYRNSFAYNTSRINTFSNNNNNMNSLPNSQSFIMMNRFAQNPPLSSMSRQFNTNNYNNTNTNNNNNNNNKQYY
jgi:hypothetical protein